MKTETTDEHSSSTTDHYDDTQQAYIVERNNVSSTPDMVNLRANPASPVIFMAGQGEKAGGLGVSETVSPTLKGSRSGLNQVPTIAKSLTASPTASGRMDPTAETFIADVSPTLSTVAGHHGWSVGDQDVNQLIPLSGVRRLTPIECERLMGLPDGWTEWGLDENGKVVHQSDSARYRQCGNSVATVCITWIAKRIKEFS